MPKYRWRCLACETPNAPEATCCMACGCPVEASGFDIERYSPISRAAKKITLWRFVNYSLAIIFVLLASLFAHSFLFFLATLAFVAFLILNEGYQIHQNEVDIPLFAGNLLAIIFWVLCNSPFGGDIILMGLLMFVVLACMLCGIATWAAYIIARRKSRLSSTP